MKPSVVLLLRCPSCGAGPLESGATNRAARAVPGLRRQGGLILVRGQKRN